MAFLEEWTYDIAEGQFPAYREWLEANEAELAKHMPEGCEYVGSFACVFGDDSRGIAKTVIRLDSYGAMDAAVDGMRKPGRYADLMQEAMAFSTSGITARNGHELWKDITDTVYQGE